MKILTEKDSLMWGTKFPDCRVMEFKREDEWKDARKSFICASEAACVLGIGFQDNIWLWEQKTGRGEEPKFSQQTLELMMKGKQNESRSRDQWEIDTGHKVWDGTMKLIVNNKILDEKGNPFLACTLDAVGEHNLGYLYDIELKRGESIKVFSDPVNMPDKYRAQVLHQMIVTGLQHAVLVARVVWFESDCKRHVVEREYWLHADDPDTKYDMDQLLEAERKFWNKYVLTCVRPARLLPNI